MLKNEDKIFNNLYGFEPNLTGAKKEVIGLIQKIFCIKIEMKLLRN